MAYGHLVYTHIWKLSLSHSEQPLPPRVHTVQGPVYVPINSLLKIYRKCHAYIFFFKLCFSEFALNLQLNRSMKVATVSSIHLFVSLIVNSNHSINGENLSCLPSFLPILPSRGLVPQIITTFA